MLLSELGVAPMRRHPDEIQKIWIGIAKLFSNNHRSKRQTRTRRAEEMIPNTLDSMRNGPFAAVDKKVRKRITNGVLEGLRDFSIFVLRDVVSSSGSAGGRATPRSNVPADGRSCLVCQGRAELLVCCWFLLFVDLGCCWLLRG